MKYGLIGERLGHSFSKPIHEALADYEYEILELAPEEVGPFISGRNFTAINVTIPYKETVMPYLDEIDPTAMQVGSVNTVVNRGGRLTGYNTDVFGMTELFKHAGISPEGKKLAILGSGGTAKTARACARLMGASEVVCVSRTPSDGSIGYAELYERHADTEIIVNTTPLGMYPAVDGCPIDPKRLPCIEGIVDAVYNPLRTELVLRARELGIRAEGGLYMLVAQAVKASEIFTDRTYPDGTTERIYEKIYKEKENVVLAGMPSSGKSSVGRRLAELLGRGFADTDELIAAKEGADIPTIFAERGEAYFRDAESRAVSECARSSSLVIATGGGAILRRENLRALSRSGRIFFIDRPLELLMPTEDRPLSKTREAIERRYAERYLVYTATCDVHIDGSGSVNEVADRIIKEFCK